ncbi:hypothetical protein SAMN05421781_0020 [Marinococcus luteus]|uniref:Uncharacterized protein n=1 Tax=Marinococcus luteus TaxID=1122204 RepID=A0A1H2YA25_9BACI|nr:hypothetical protein [Marinococcus luteus]SDX01977.1 hypothetical protein SAMN05421781_0020 [Marinococcus luteus]
MQFNEEGLLPPKDYELTIDELRESMLVHGPPDAEIWDSQWRRKLVNNLEIMVNQLKQVGITEIYIDGSFVEDKAHPNDIDGYFECNYMHLATTLEHELNTLDPYFVWTWDARERKPYPGDEKAQLPMWHQYRVELYPEYGQGSGLVDENGNEQKFPAAFRKTRSGHIPKGIIKIIE